MTLLEATLRERLGKLPALQVERALSLQQLLRRVPDDFFHLVSRGGILDWIKLRNQVVHSAKLVTKSEARTIVEGVERILGIQTAI